MKFYILKDSYIDYLQQFDTKVPDNKNEARPYVGVVLEIDDIKFYAPFTSPKPKHQNMRNRKDFRKIDGGRLGAINFNNMIPVYDCALIDFDKETLYSCILGRIQMDESAKSKEKFYIGEILNSMERTDQAAIYPCQYME